MSRTANQEPPFVLAGKWSFVAQFSRLRGPIGAKKIIVIRCHCYTEGDEEDSDVSSSDESDWSSDEDDDESMEGGFDDSICPPGCDQVR